MKATCWMGKTDVQVKEVPDPKILNQRDAIVRITATAICGSDLHLYNGFVPSMMKGDILGHEFMGEVVEVGSEVRNLRAGDRVVVPFPIACGGCLSCQQQMFSLCENSNPNTGMAEQLWGHSPAGIFGYSHLTGGYAGGQAEYARVPYSDYGPIKIPDGIEDERVLFLSDIYPTGWMAAENAQIQPGDTVAIWGCGPVGLFAIKSAILQGAGRVIAIDRHPNRLALAKANGAEVLNYHEVKVREALLEMTAGLGPDSCIDAVGMESHGFSPDNIIDAVKQETRLGTDRPHVLRETIMAVRKGGTVSVPGVYGGVADKWPVGAFMEKGLTLKTGQTHVQRYLPQLLQLVLDGKIDTTDLISHRLPLEQAAEGYKNFKENQNEWTKVVLKPGWERAQ